VDSDHLPLQLRIRRIEEENKEDRREGKAEERKDRTKEIIIWYEKAIKKYKERTEVLMQEVDQGKGTIEDRWQWIKGIVVSVMERKRIRIRRRKKGFKDWWNRDCIRRKRKVQRNSNTWRKGKIGRDQYLEEKKKLRKFMERKQKEKMEKVEKELMEIRKEMEIWRYINKKRGRKIVEENNIGREE